MNTFKNKDVYFALQRSVNQAVYNIASVTQYYI